jgi:hypothetical protein
MRADDIKNTLDKGKHVLTGVLLEHRDREEMKVDEFAVDVDSNAVVEVRFAVMG